MPNCPDIPQLSCVAGEIGSQHDQAFIDWLNSLREQVCGGDSFACPTGVPLIDELAGDIASGAVYQCTDIGGLGTDFELREVNIACDLSQPIERVDITGLALADWAATPEVGNLTRFYDAPLTGTYDISNSYINTRMPNEAYTNQNSGADAQGTFYEFIDAGGNPASVSGNMATGVRVYASGVGPFRENIHLDIISNNNWLVQHVREEIVETNLATNQTFTTAPLLPISNFNAATIYSNQMGRSIRWANKSIYIQKMELIGTAAAPQVRTTYNQQTTGAPETFIFMAQLISYEG